MMTVIKTDGEAHEKALNQVYELLKVLEEGMKSFFPRGSPTLNYTTKNLNLLDIVAGSVFCPFKTTEQVLGTKIIDPEKTPMLFSWVKALSELPLMKEATPPHEKLFEILKYFREICIKTPAA
ncbi:Glutathione S-transferase, C-terminal-like [Trema orientale]|uniref:Glutathione S-transferase, C-terminal-like n=1 Tax=Trema orientale TaxID=63057 RepID=A0A2P5F737_TREOI|nr:Glutathione S-transferase, C-terminal-like [Trema orientale]